ncbi:MAG: SDR family NAD(P)-dependent oxidoreductase [Pseudomonadota bacterium]|nr:SDR family NAD(P)-dependent oxidoreductase [Pseudomonadota bacterium]
MRWLARQTTGCVVVIGWQAAEIAAQLLQYSGDNLPHYVIQPTVSSQTTVSSIQYVQADLNQADAVSRVFSQLAKRGHHPQLVVFQAEPSLSDQFNGFSADQLEQRWQQTGLSLFLWAQAAITALQHPAKQRQSASLIVLGSDLALRPEVSLAVDSALYVGMRALLQSLAREFQPQGIHVAYVGLPVASDTNPTALATLCWQLHQQPASAWTHEVQFSSITA